MKFDTSSGPAGNSALLESRIIYPRRDEQCLQFFYKTNGAPGDKLVIWVRTDDGTGNIQSVKKIHTITGILRFLFQKVYFNSVWPSLLLNVIIIKKLLISLLKWKIVECVKDLYLKNEVNSLSVFQVMEILPGK